MSSTMRRVAAVAVFAAVLAWAYGRGGWPEAAFSALVMATSASLAYLYA